MIDLVEKAEWAHKLLDLCTRLIIDWLKAQQKAMGGTVEGIFILDDIVGFVSEEHYQEFAHPYLKRICDAFPKDWVKIYHNDAAINACLDHLPDCGFNVLNWGKQMDIAEVKDRVGDRMCLMGNVNPLEVGVRVEMAESQKMREMELMQTLLAAATSRMSRVITDWSRKRWIRSRAGKSATAARARPLFAVSVSNSHAETAPNSLAKLHAKFNGRVVAEGFDEGH
jgi:hypothetical protein